jgi:hypothetical protein
LNQFKRSCVISKMNLRLRFRIMKKSTKGFQKTFTHVWTLNVLKLVHHMICATCFGCPCLLATRGVRCGTRFAWILVLTPTNWIPYWRWCIFWPITFCVSWFIILHIFIVFFKIFKCWMKIINFFVELKIIAQCTQHQHLKSNNNNYMAFKCTLVK